METPEIPKTLKRWKIFSKWLDEELEKLVHVTIFGTGGGDSGYNSDLGALILSKDDAVSRVGFVWFGEESSSDAVEVTEMTGLSLKKIEVGRELCVALTVDGRLYCWADRRKKIPASAIVCYELLSSDTRCRYCSSHTIRVFEFGGLKFKNGCPNCCRFTTSTTYSLEESEGKLVAKLVKFADGVICCTKCHCMCSSTKIGKNEVNYCKTCDYFPQDATHFDAPEMKRELLDFGESNKVVAMACGRSFFIALTDKNDLIIWGEIVGYKFEGTAYNPDNVKIKAISCGGYHAAVLSVQGDVYTCGYGCWGQLGYDWTAAMGCQTLRKVPLRSRVVKVCCGYTSSVCLMDDGSLMSFGSSMKLMATDVLALNQTEDDFISQPARILITKKLTDVVNSPLTNIYFAKADSLIFSWGDKSADWEQPRILLGESDLMAAMADLPATFNLKAPCARQSTLSPHLDSELYGKKFLSDLTLKLSDGDFPAHRLILHTNSAYFRNAFEGNCSDNVLDMTGYNPEAYKCLLKYFYRMPPSDLSATDLLDLYILANGYKETDIAHEVFAKLKATLNHETVLPLLRKAKEVNCAEILEECNVFIRSPELKHLIAEKVSEDLDQTLSLLELLDSTKGPNFLQKPK